MIVKRLNKKIQPNSKRVVLQFLQLSKERSERIINNVLQLSDNQSDIILNNVIRDFSNRHRNFESKLYSNYLKVNQYIKLNKKINQSKKLLIGSYFSKEYSISAAALFNPSIVQHPVQSNLEKGSIRFIMSLRATGEGHISSIEFREGLIKNDLSISLIEASRYCSIPNDVRFYKKDVLNKKLKFNDESEDSIKDILDSNYSCSYDDGIPINERVLFPISKSECVGMEDARFVKFVENGNSTYYGTYTAYNGKSFRTQLLQSNDFVNFNISTLHGNVIKDKGMAIFPRKINNKYVITSRQDGENLFIMTSKNIYSWDSVEKLKTPEHPWEYIQIGNCGSPIETDQGWILITHAVGPMRRYVISAILLDLENPAKVIGTLSEPLIEPNEKEREGYVPNVVYSCGSMIHNNHIVIPYAFSDSASGFASVNISKLLRKFI